MYIKVYQGPKHSSPFCAASICNAYHFVLPADVAQTQIPPQNAALNLNTAFITFTFAQ